MRAPLSSNARSTGGEALAWDGPPEEGNHARQSGGRSTPLLPTRPPATLPGPLAPLGGTPLAQAQARVPPPYLGGVSVEELGGGGDVYGQ